MRRYVITVWDNPEFACEIAYVAAKRSDLRVLLIDANLLSPTVDLYLNVKRYSDKIEDKKTGLELAIDSINRNFISYDLIESISCKRRELPNLSILTGSYSIDNYEYFSRESFVDLIKKCSENYDLTFIIANKFIYDAYTVTALAMSDYNILPLHAYLASFREYNNYLTFLRDKQGIELDKTKFVAYSYISQNHISKSTVNVLSEGNSWGTVAFSKRRIRLRKNRTPYAKVMEKTVEGDYISILTRLKIEMKMTFWEKLLKTRWA